MPPRLPTVSPIQVIFGAHPKAVRYVSGQMNRVNDISNPEGERRDGLSVRIREAIARRMSVELRQRAQHEDLQEQRRRARQAARDDNGDEQADAEPAADLPEFFDAIADPGEAPVPARGAVAGVRARDISLIEVTEDALVRTRVFPRSAHCAACGHFLLLDPERPPATLACPCCGEGNLSIEPIVFICGRCATVRELLPKGARTVGDHRETRRVDQSLGAAPACPDCGDGHIHLEKHSTNEVARWQWKCTSCTDYELTLQERCVRCAVAGADGESASTVFMQAIPATAPTALEPLTDARMFVGETEIDMPALRAQVADQGDEWPDHFTLHDAVEAGDISGGELGRITDASVQDAYLVKDVRAFTTVYGYKPGTASRHPLSPLEPEDRLAQFFRDPEGLARFMAYCVSTKGTALVVEFDPDTLVERLSHLHPEMSGMTYEDVAAADAQAIQNHQLRELIAEGTRAPLYQAMHALEHALLGSAMLQTGTDELGSRLFFRDAAVVIFERAEIGRGGVVQLTNRGVGLVQLLAAAADHMLGCAQGCADGCPACVYVRDQHCFQPLDELRRSWLPANSLLSRCGAAQILSPGLNI